MSQLHRKLCGQPGLPRRTQPAAAYRAGTGPRRPLSLMPWLAGPGGRVPPAGFNPAMGLRSPDTGHMPGAVFRIPGDILPPRWIFRSFGRRGAAAVAGAWAARRPCCGRGAGRPPSDRGLSGPHRPAREHRRGGRSSRVQARRARPDPVPTAGSRPTLTCRRDVLARIAAAITAPLGQRWHKAVSLVMIQRRGRSCPGPSAGRLRGMPGTSSIS